MSEPICLLGTRIILRDWRVEDLDLWEAWMEPHHSWHRLDAPYFGSMSDEEIVSRRSELERRIAVADWPDPRTNLVVSDRHTSKLIGRVSWYWTSQPTDWRTIGIDIYDSDRWRRGIGTEALGLWVDYLFASLPATVRLDLRTWSGNHAMVRLARKLGFVEEARFRLARVVNGSRHDSLGYGILRQEWEELHPNGFASSARSCDE